MGIFNQPDLKKLYKPKWDSSKEDNGQITIIGGSSLFHGAPLLSLKVASRIVDMVFFASPEPSIGRVAEKIKSRLFSFIWVPWNEVEEYVAKSDACLIGPGFMRFASEQRTKGKEQRVLDGTGKKTREITERLLKKFPGKHWVIDAGSLQVIDPEFIPKDSILTPNTREFEILFDTRVEEWGSRKVEVVKGFAKKYQCVIVSKGPKTIVCSSEECILIEGGNPGLTKGGTGDVLAGLTVALLAKNDSFLAAFAASDIAKKTGDELYKKVGTNYNADDLAEKIPEALKILLGT